MTRIEKYRKEKLRVFKDFGIPITTDIIRGMEERETEYAIDRYCEHIIVTFLDKYE